VMVIQTRTPEEWNLHIAEVWLQDDRMTVKIPIEDWDAAVQHVEEARKRLIAEQPN
jgi:hypothetical protein